MLLLALFSSQFIVLCGYLLQNVTYMPCLHHVCDLYTLSILVSIYSLVLPRLDISTS